jgi:hypothetical protein
MKQCLAINRRGVRCKNAPINKCFFCHEHRWWWVSRLVSLIFLFGALAEIMSLFLSLPDKAPDNKIQNPIKTYVYQPTLVDNTQLASKEVTLTSTKTNISITSTNTNIYKAVTQTPKGYDRITIILDYYDCINDVRNISIDSSIHLIRNCSMLLSDEYQSSYNIIDYSNNYSNRVISGNLHYCNDDTVFITYYTYDQSNILLPLEGKGNPNYLRFTFAQNTFGQLKILHGYDSIDTFNTWRKRIGLPDISFISEGCGGVINTFGPALTLFTPP